MALAPQACVVLMPVASRIEPPVETALRELEHRGYAVWRQYGYSAIDQGRCLMATKALAEGFAETLWIDSDVAFEPDDVDRLRAHDLPIACGIYPQKGARRLACHVIPGSEEIVFGQEGGLCELLYAGAGFLHVRREVYETIERKLELPMCNLQAGDPLVPYFLPFIHEKDGQPWYLGEDFAFCERVRACGYKIMADTTIRLRHFGSYGYSWEDAGSSMPRYAKYRFKLERKGDEDAPGDG